jgi:aldose 1-epimerase
MLGIDKVTECTGALPAVLRGIINDLWSKLKQLGTSGNDPAWAGNCGTGSGSSGYNNQSIVDRNASDWAKPVTILSSDYTGIK